LLTGESGVGKEVVARMIHRMSRPVSAPFVPVNCGGLAETLLESELFGHEKGAFTGADRQIPGVFEMAKGGTVFLDEISEMSAAAQSRFLRVIEDRTVRRVRGTKEIGIENTRIITATNQDLQNLVATGKFRKDLYYRTMVAPIDIPPLRERPEDILPLAYYFLDRFSRDTNRTFRLSGRTDRALLASDFPGNIRDLRNMIERGTIFASRDIIEPEDMGLSCDSVSGDVIIPEALDEPLAEPVSFSLADNEKHLIERAIEMHGDNHSATARSLGITPQALYRKIDKHGLRDS
jgi:transcriptional regulator with PAS, ATPase and Fis domain